MNLKTKEEKIRSAIAAWETLAPEKSFAGMTLGEFKEKVQPSLASRDEILVLEHKILAAKNARIDTDKASVAVIHRVVSAIKGDAAEGDDGKLYEAFGYVRKSERSSGLHRRKTLLAAAAR